MSGGDFSGANLQEAILWSANLKGSNLSGTNLTDAIFGGNLLIGTNFKDARNAIFENVYFNDTIMPDGTIRNGRC